MKPNWNSDGLLDSISLHLMCNVRVVNWASRLKLCFFAPSCARMAVRKIITSDARRFGLILSQFWILPYSRSFCTWCRLLEILRIGGVHHGWWNCKHKVHIMEESVPDFVNTDDQIQAIKWWVDGWQTLHNSSSLILRLYGWGVGSRILKYCWTACNRFWSLQQGPSLLEWGAWANWRS